MAEVMHRHLVVSLALLGLLTGCVTAGVGPTGAETITHLAVIDSSTYKVRVTGEHVTVANQALVTSFNLVEREKMRAAVKQATGCELVDEVFLETRLGGKLRC